MNQGLGHDQMRDLLSGAALEILDGEELRQVLAHARDCAECGKLLEEYRQVTAQLSLELPPAGQLDPDRSAAVRRRLLARARADQRPAPTPARGAPNLIYRWSGWLVAASLAGVLLVHHSIHQTLDYGWFIAGVLMFLLVAVGVFGLVQRGRVAELRDRLGEKSRGKDV